MNNEQKADLLPSASLVQNGMLAAGELRPGNYLKYFIGEEGVEWDATKIDIQDLVWANGKNENFNQVHKPIEITDTVLVHNGFVYDDTNGNFWMNLQTHYLELISGVDGFYPIYVQMPELSTEPEQRVGLRRVRFIHELQNLFFVLTGEEWKVVV